MEHYYFTSVGQIFLKNNNNNNKFEKKKKKKKKKLERTSVLKEKKLVAAIYLDLHVVGGNSFKYLILP